jgi:hypothetical protein
MSQQDNNESQVTPEPLPDNWPELAVELTETFVTGTVPSEQEQTCIEEFSGLCLKYAHLEKRIQGEIVCEIPASLTALDEPVSIDLLQEAEALATTERRHLELQPGPVEFLAEALDDLGIKIIERPHPEGNYCGGFLFTEATGPALLSMAPPGFPVGNVILAHQYCHLLADNNPYENRFCHHGVTPLKDSMGLGGRTMEQAGDISGDETALSEARADMFARCFLLPAKHFRLTLADFGVEGSGDAFAGQLDRLADLAFYYNVPTPLVLNRLLDLQLLSLKQTRDLHHAFSTTPTRNESETELLGGLITAAPTDEISGILARLPKRYLTLAIALLMKNQVSKTQMETLLDLDGERLEHFLAWTEIPAGVLRAEQQKNSGKTTDILDDHRSGN